MTSQKPIAVITGMKGRGRAVIALIKVRAGLTAPACR
jgi:hypothetical protein